ncbi:MAG: LacI family DNA-binding transcriptional regulator [Lachnospiraceae bacterium]|nr:LacI family DNA-binding transcriptional regulator [Lachnospiraceae bacterium]
MQEIAELAGTSVATVSRVINRNGRYSKETEARVLKVIRDNRYVPNESAKGLRTTRTQTIGVVVPDITNPHFSSLVNKIETGMFERGYSCIICNTNESEQLEIKHIQSLRAQNVSGMVLISCLRYHAEFRNLPTVYLDRPAKDTAINEGIMICSDNDQGGYLATKELLAAGCKKILVVKAHGDDINQTIRFQGAMRALEEEKVRFSKDMLLDLDHVSIKQAEQEMDAFLKKKKIPDGIMTTTDTIAVGIYLSLRKAGLRVPKDIRLTGFDDCYLAESCGPGLTSVHQDVSQMASMAIDFIMRRLKGDAVEDGRYYLPVTLTRRESTAY